MQKPGSIREVEISLTGDEFETYWKEAHESALEKVSLKGFRKGTAPKELADQAVDKDAVFHTAVEAAARINLKELAEENNWTFIDTPKIEVLEATKKTGKEKPGLRYKAHLTIFPEVILGEYKKIAEKVLKSKKEVSISDEEIEKSLAWLRDSRAKQILKNGTAERGDVIEGDISSMVDGKAITGGDLKGDTFVLGQSRFVPGFDDMLIGKKAGEEATFSLTAPNDYWQKDLQNKEIAFTVYIKGVYTREFPPIDDAFANMLSPQFKTLDDLKKNMREGLLFERKEKEKERMRGEILEKIISESKIDLPEVMAEKTLDALVEETKILLKDAPENMKEDTVLRKNLAEKADKRIKGQLVLYAIAQKEALEPTEEEVKEEAQRRNLDQTQYDDYSYGIAQHKKVFEFLEQNYE